MEGCSDPGVPPFRSRVPRVPARLERGQAAAIVPRPDHLSCLAKDLPRFDITPAAEAIEKCPKKIILKTVAFPEGVAAAASAAAHSSD